MTARKAQGAPLVSGERVTLLKGHPHAGAEGRLVIFEAYGPSVFGWKGWRVRLDDGHECYAKLEALRRVFRP